MLSPKHKSHQSRLSESKPQPQPLSFSRFSQIPYKNKVLLKRFIFSLEPHERETFKTMVEKSIKTTKEKTTIDIKDFKSLEFPKINAKLPIKFIL